MANKPDLRFSALGLIGAVFAPIGLILIVVGFAAGGAVKRLAEQTDSGTGLHTFQLVFVGVGLLFLVLGAVFLSSALRKILRQKHVIEHGDCISAEFVSAEPDRHVTVNGVHPYTALVRGRDRFGEAHEFRSGHVSSDPTAQLAGREIPVYLDPDDPENYYVDLDSVLSGL